MGRVSALVDTGKQVYEVFTGKNVTLMAGGIAYYAFLSLVPLLVLLLMALSLVGPEMQQRVIEIAQGSLPESIAGVISGVFESREGIAGASVIGVVVLLWGGLKIFRGLDTAFSEIYGSTEKSSFLDQVLDGLVVLVTILVALVATIGATAVFAALSGVVPYIGLVTPLVVVAGLVLAFLPMYYKFPDADVDVRTILPGTVFAALGWAVMQSLFQVYVAVSGGQGGFFGGVIVVITWLYFSALVFLLGAVINAVRGGFAGESTDAPAVSGHMATTREERLSPEEFAVYLRTLQLSLSNRDADAHPVTAPEDADRYPTPVEDVELVEQTSGDDSGEREYAISFRWKSPPEWAKTEVDD